MERIVSLAIGIVIALLGIQFQVTYFGLAIIAGVVIPIFFLLRDRNQSDDQKLGYASIFLGLLVLLVAYIICVNYGISFQTLDRDYSFPRRIRNLPYLGIAFLTSGVTFIVISIIGKRSR